MKNKQGGFWLICFILLTLSLNGQTKNYPIKKINGIEYYVYSVQPSEGLLAIGRKFNVSAEEIANVNAAVKMGLKPGQELYIPIQNKSTENSTEFIKHSVEKKQTLFAISHKYYVSQADIEKYNPDLKTGLKDGMVLNIPVKMKTEKSTAVKSAIALNSKPGAATIQTPVQEKNFSIHKVKPNETLYSICKLHNVDIKEVIKINPGVDKSLAINSEIKIPQKKSSVETESVKPEPEIIKLKPKPTIKEEYSQKKTIRMAFLLPFMLDQTKKEAVLERFQNFYAGALLAIEAAKKQGISFEIYSFDTDKTTEKMAEILTNSELKTMDLIIGPAFSNQVPLIGTFAKENKVNTLIPFTAKVPDIETNPFLFQFNPGTDSEFKYLLELINTKLSNMHIVFAEIQGISPLDEGKIKVEYLKKELVRQHKNPGIIELNSPEGLNFIPELKKGQKNLIIFNSDKFSAISPYLNALNTIPEEYNITLLEQYSWRNQLEKKPESIYISAFTNGLNESLTTEYNSNFNRYYAKDLSADSPRYDMLGFDLISYFCRYIYKYGSKFPGKIGLIQNIPALQSQVQFERNSNESGFINQKVYLSEIKGQ